MWSKKNVCVICIKGKGHNTEPLGTSQEVGSISEKQLPILMACRLSVRYEVNQLRAVPDIPYHVDKRVMRMLWSIVSKAADRSSRVSSVTLPLSMLRLMSLCIFKRAVSVDWNCLYADCDTLDRPFMQM